MKRIKYIIRHFFTSIFNSYMKLILFFSLFFSKKNQPIFVFDLDNTIANTWPSFLDTYPSEYSRLKNLKPFPKMVDCFQAMQSNYKCIVLTARHSIYYPVTIQWLKSHVASISIFNIFLCKTPRNKVNLLKLFIKKFSKVIYIDDLTYNQENGEEKLYKDIISTVKKLNLIYLDNNVIKTIQNGKKRLHEYVL